MIVQVAEGILLAAGVLFAICFIWTGLYHASYG